MREWHDIVNAALLGTGKKAAISFNADASLSKALDQLSQNTELDNEERFLQQASLIYNYRQSGFQPLLKEHLPFSEAPIEEKDYCSVTAVSSLNDLLELGDSSLLKLWLELCASNNQIIPSEYLPRFMSIGKDTKSLQSLIILCSGERGKWMIKFNNDWAYAAVNEDRNTIWKTGTALQRKELLSSIRKEDPAAAIELLKTTWEQEDAATKTQFLEILKPNIAEADLEFLISIGSDKSKKVKDLAFDLQKRIPNSDVVLSYCEILKVATKHKSLIGSSIDFKLPVLPEIVYKSGIEKLSSVSTVSDHDHVLLQLVSFIPPDFWEKHLNIEADAFLKLISKHLLHQELFNSLASAAVRFKNKKWAIAISKECKFLIIELLNILDSTDADNYCIQMFNGNQMSILQFYLTKDEEWSISIANKLVEFISQNPISYGGDIYQNRGLLYPISLISTIDRFAPQNADWQHHWFNLKEKIKKLIQLKSSILNAFSK